MYQCQSAHFLLEPWRRQGQAHVFLLSRKYMPPGGDLEIPWIYSLSPYYRDQFSLRQWMLWQVDSMTLYPDEVPDLLRLHL